MEVVAEPLKHVTFIPACNFPLHFVQGKMNYVVMMNFLARQVVRQFQPHLVQQINFFRRQSRRMRPEVKNLLLPGRSENLERHARPRFRHSLPYEADFTGLIR